MDSSPLTPQQSQTLALICDALLPEKESNWRATASQRAGRLLQHVPDREAVRRLVQLLDLMELPAANLALARRRHRFSALDRAGRQAYLGAMAGHRLGLVRGAFRELKRLAAVAYYADADRYGHNPVWSTLGYPGPIALSLASDRTIAPLQIENDTDLECDVVVVGSGAGGGMAAAELSEAGHDVIVLESGGYLTTSDFTQREVQMLQRLYLDGGTLTTADRGVMVLAGSCLGGGTTVNYTTSLRLPDVVREEWVRVSGLDFFARDEFTRSLEAADARFQSNLDHNQPSRRDALMECGLQARGWHAARMPRNVAGCTQDDVCGYCGLGCVRAAKCSTVHTCLAGAYRQGARIVVNCTAQQVTIDNGRAVGIDARTDGDHEVRVRARAVVVAAGAINTPGLLLRSGFGPPVGENLRLHPVTAVTGSFAEAVRPWTGTLQAVYSEQFADQDGGYGFRFETAPLHPALTASSMPWSGPEQFDGMMRRLAHLSPIGILLRDRGGGSVSLSRSGRPLVHYRISRYDQRHVRAAVQAAAEVLLAAGAEEIFSTQIRPVAYRPDSGTDLAEWMHRVDAVGYGPNQTQYLSFHQMGSCRMGSWPEMSVAGESGETHAVKGLFVADGSLFPTACGVNPMITIAALAHHVAQHIKAGL